MRLSEWRASAPNREALSARVLDVVTPVVEALGAETDPHCWVAWGDDPSVRYMIFAPTAAGLVQCSVRLALPGEGPRASGKVTRWHRVQLGELAVETVGGHRLVSFQVESQVLRGADLVADAIAAFGLALFAAIDGRPIPDLGTRKPRRKAAPAKASSAKASSAKATRGATSGGGAGKRPGTAAPGRAPAARPATPKAATAPAPRPKAGAAGPARPAGDVAAPPRPSPSPG